MSKSTRIVITLPSGLDERFRKDAYDTYGFKKGSLQKAWVEACNMWLDAKTGPVRRISNGGR